MERFNDLKTGVSGKYRDWTGVLRRGRKVIATCGHNHANRDLSSIRNGPSALDCIRTQLHEVRHMSAFGNLHRLESQVYGTDE
jgi:hypothetical protein